MRSYRYGFLLLVVCCVLSNGARAQTIRCASDDGARKHCDLDTKQGVRLVKQVSDAPCKQGDSWGYDEHGVWVDHGCGAEFAAGTQGTAGATSSGNTARILTCTSDGGKKYCDVHTGRGVRLVKQRSEAPCKKDVSWGYDGLGIRVDGGCSADFELGGSAPASGAASGGADNGKAQDQSCLKQAGKAHADQLVKQCLQVSPATHPPCNSANSCELIEDEIRRSCALLGREAPAFCGGYK